MGDAVCIAGMKTLFLGSVVAAAAAVWGAGTELVEVSTARGPSEYRVPANRLVRIESVTWSYQETSVPGKRAGVWWWDGVGTWEVSQGNSFLGPGVLQVVRGELPREHVLVLLRLEEVAPVAPTNQVRVKVEASSDLLRWAPVGEVRVPAPEPGRAVFVRAVPDMEGKR